jgi:Holliday junction resolvasome RuvABC endonuclease subunit
MSLLALDPSLSVIGWCRFKEGLPVAFGSHRLTTKGIDDKLEEAAKWLGTMLLPGINEVAIEVPVLSKNPATLRSLAQLTGVLRYRARMTHNGLPRRIIEVLPSERLSALGLPIRMTRDAAKAAVIMLVQQIYGITVANDDEADAIAVGEAAIKKMRLEEMGE